jgi:8-oxo-dGTP diphosphatase
MARCFAAISAAELPPRRLLRARSLDMIPLSTKVRPAVPLATSDIDWSSWTPRETATVLFVIRDGQILLILKKRGLGAGKINAPGGRIEAGEQPIECAVREVQEELRVTPTGVDPRGTLSFQWVEGYSLHVHVFVASDCEGQATETEEAEPRWTDIDRIPYDDMWDDDAIWLPMVLAGAHIRGRFTYEGERMLDHQVLSRPPGSDPPPVP